VRDNGAPYYGGSIDNDGGDGPSLGIVNACGRYIQIVTNIINIPMCVHCTARREAGKHIRMPGRCCRDCRINLQVSNIYRGVPVKGRVVAIPRP